MPPAQSRFEIKWSGETAVRAGTGAASLSGTEWRLVAAVKREDMRAGGPRTQEAQLAKCDCPGKKVDFAKALKCASAIG